MVRKAQPTVSLQLKKLRTARILSCRKEGRKCIYRVSDQATVKIMRMME
jgi:DNA-binding transcriptional ArsR family regulator